MNKTPRIFLAALIAVGVSAEAQTTGSGSPSGNVSVSQMVSAQCPKFSSQIVDRPELKPILSQRPVDIGAVCTCTQRSFLADARLQVALNVEDQVLVERMQSERMRAYLTTRLMASVLACLAPELERSLAATSPAR